jgi:hypothetical protein
MRSLELQRAMLRATNTGATAIVDHRGRVVAQLPPHTAGVLVGSVEGREGVTPYAWWAARAGLAPLWALGLAVAAALSSHRVRAGGPARPARRRPPVNSPPCPRARCAAPRQAASSPRCSPSSRSS